MHKFQIEITKFIDDIDNKTSWWVSITGHGELYTGAIGKRFSTEQEAIDYAKSYLAGYREQPK